jgi:hypothetical protein
VNQLLRFLLLRCPFLWDDGRYRIVDSLGESITVASAEVRLCFTCKRGGVAIDVEPVRAGPVSGRYALGSLCALIGWSECLDDAALLRASLPDIEALFRGEPVLPMASRRRDACLT